MQYERRSVENSLTVLRSAFPDKVNAGRLKIPGVGLVRVGRVMAVEIEKSPASTRVLLEEVWSDTTRTDYQVVHLIEEDPSETAEDA